MPPCLILLKSTSWLKHAIRRISTFATNIGGCAREGFLTDYLPTYIFLPSKKSDRLALFVCRFLTCLETFLDSGKVLFRSALSAL